MCHNYLCLDPSFSSTGVALFNPENKKITLRTLGVPSGFHKGFNGVYSAANSISDSLYTLMDSLCFMPSYVISEYPPPTMMAPGLFALDTLLLDRISHKDYIKEVWTVAPSYLKTLHFNKKYNKKAHHDLFTKLKQPFLDEGYSFDTRMTSTKTPKPRICDDEEVAFFFGCRFLIHLLPQHSISLALSLIHPPLTSPKEKLLGTY